MYAYPWHFRAALKTLQKKGLFFFFHKSVRYVYLSFSGERENQWWNSKKGLEDANDKILTFVLAQSQGEPDAGDAFLYRSFMRNIHVYPGLPREYIPILLKSIERRQVCRDFGDDAQDILLEKTQEIDPLSLPLGSWLGLHYVCLRNGLFKTAYWVRQKAVEKAYFEAENCRIGNLAAAFRAAIDQAEFEKARKYLDYLRKRNLKNSYGELESYYYLNMGNIGAFRKIKEKMFASHDQKFMGYVEGKSIAIVGPAPSGEEHGEEIDSFDVVVRFNYRGRDTLPDCKEFGKRTEISYYNMPFVKEINESKMNPFEEIDFAIFKKVEYDIQKHPIEMQKGRIRKKNYHFFNGAPLVGSHALYDILHFRPARVKLFNVNFYLSNTPYYSGYSENEFIKYLDTFNFVEFARHDMVSNINFTRNLWNAGLIEVDTACSEVLRLTIYEYLSTMEKLFVRDI